MNYPSFKIKGFPTPNSILMVCDICQQAAWTYPTPRIMYCCNHRMREATPQEYIQGQKALKRII